MKPIEIGRIRTELIWFDSMGAKSSSVFVKTPDIALLIDPGAAGMQPSYPLSPSEKEKLRAKALSAIRDKAKYANYIFISHYHYDHHTLPSEARDIYEKKTLWVKNPNRWINRSQWERSRLFLYQLHSIFIGGDSSSLLISPERMDSCDPVDELPSALSRDYGDYANRKRELLRKGKKWLEKLFRIWSSNPWVDQFNGRGLEVIFVDGKEVKIGATRIKFTEPLFHGIEYDRVGWVIGLVLEYRSKKILYTSDLQGPMIEDYADWIIRENPDLIIADGPPTYLLGYMLNQINLRRAIENMVRIIDKTEATLIIYDHHLLREKSYKQRLKQVYEEALARKRKLITAAEWCGEEPLILKLTR